MRALLCPCVQQTAPGDDFPGRGSDTSVSQVELQKALFKAPRAGASEGTAWLSMDDDVPLILTLDDSGSSASAPLDDLDREELPNESKSTLSFPARCLSLWGGCSSR